MPYELSYAGVYLPLASPELEAFLARIHPQQFWDMDSWNFAGFNLEQLPTPSFPSLPERPVQFGVLNWPRGASRPAFIHLVLNTSRLDAVRSAVGDPMTPKSLVMADSRVGKSVTASMYMLPPRPLNQLGVAAKDGWVVTLTDRRWYDHWRKGVLTQPSSWTDLFSKLATILDTTISVDSVHADYGVPSTKWVQYYQPTPTILDAAAAQVGQVVVYRLDGSIYTKNWDTAKSESDIQVTDVVAQCGGLLSDSDIARYVPSQVAVLFATEATPEIPHAVPKTLASLSIAEYGSSTGVAGTSGATFADLAYTGANTTAVNAYATIAATDWYGWRLQDLDVSIPGIEPWVPTGWEEYVEWTYQSRGPKDPYASTVVRRGPFDQFPSGTWYAGLTPIPPNWVPGSGSGSGGSGGSGSGCSEAVVPVEFGCIHGRMLVTNKSIAVGIENNTLVLVECAEEEVDLGPCNPENPAGIVLPVVTQGCRIPSGPTLLVTTDYEATVDDVKLAVDCSDGNVEVTLPPWENNSLYLIVVRIDGSANTVTIVPFEGGGTINGDPNVVLLEWEAWTFDTLPESGTWFAH